MLFRYECYHCYFYEVDLATCGVSHYRKPAPQFRKLSQLKIPTGWIVLTHGICDKSRTPWESRPVRNWNNSGTTCHLSTDGRTQVLRLHLLHSIVSLLAAVIDDTRPFLLGTDDARLSSPQPVGLSNILSRSAWYMILATN